MAGRRRNPLDTSLPLSDSDGTDDFLEDLLLPDLEPGNTFEEETIRSDGEQEDTDAAAVEDLSTSGQSSHSGTIVSPIIVADSGVAGHPTMSNRWLTTHRSDLQAAGMAVAVRKEDRAALSADALLKLQRASTEGMENKFFLMGNSKEDQLVQCYNLTLRVEELKHHMQKSDIISALDIFVSIIPTPLAAGTQFLAPFPGTLSLFDKAGEALSEAHVRSANRFKRYYGQTYDIQDLQWSQEFLENSCEEDLRVKVLERIRSITEVERGGALYYYHMIQLIQTDVERAARGLIDRLEAFKLKSLSGENIFVACSLIKGVVNKLQSIGRVPTDIDLTVLKIMQTSSLDEFNSFFTAIMHYNDANLGVKKTVDEILELAETMYKRHLEPGNPHPWKGTGRVGKSTFITEAEIASEKQANAAIGENEMNTQGNWNANANTNQNGGRGPGGRNRGRRGTGGWRRTPPGAGESGTKIIEGTTWLWCGTCKFWTTTHNTAQHVSRPPPAANVAIDESATVVSNSSGSAGTVGTSILSETDTKGRVSFYSNVMNKMKITD
jgi:hypothetical protein